MCPPSAVGHVPICQRARWLSTLPAIHVAALLKVCLVGLSLVHPGGRPGGYRPPPDIERVIQQGTPEQRLRALTAIRELTAVVDEFDGQRGS